MKDCKFVFVILHYYTIEDTKKCVKSILDRNKNVDIVVVDNASSNDTGKELKILYGNESHIHVILNKENLGFAKGNNVGFEYAKKNLDPDFIIMCNNDTYLIQDDFFELIISEYYKSYFAVLGPKILLPNNQVNKIKINLPSVKSLKKSIRDMKLKYITNLLYINKLYIYIRRCLKFLFVKLYKKKPKNIIGNFDERHENIILHGSFWIFSRKYIDKFDGIDNRTFLYLEEELLALRLKRNNLKSIYNPKLVIFHNEDSSTNSITKNNRRKELFISKNLIKSSKILLKELKEK